MIKFNFLIVILLILNIQCNYLASNEQSHKTVTDTCMFKSTQTWEISNYERGGGNYTLKQVKKDPIYTGSIAEFSFEDTLNLKYLKLLKLSETLKNQIIEYKLYINQKYIGKFKVNQGINISCKIKTIRVIVVKTCTEQITQAWDEDFYYTLVKDTSTTGITDLQIRFKLDSTGHSIFLKQIKNTKNKALDIAPILFATDEIPHKPVVLTKMERNGTINYEQMLSLNKQGEFQIQLLKTNRNSKSIEADLYYHGIYRVFLTENYHVGLHLNGIISGIINGKGYSKAMNYELNSEIKKDSNFVDGLPYTVLLDLPEWAMININSYDKSIYVNIPYATENNITGKKLYTCNRCFLRYVVIKSLLKAKKVFNHKGLNIKLLDCYRPLDIQKLLYEEFPVQGYVADPIGGSIHNRGTAVDLTFTDMKGKELDMGSKYDDFSVKSHVSYKNLPDTIIKMRNFLHETMLSNNFVPIRMEWWHFEFVEARKYRKMNDPFPCSGN